MSTMSGPTALPHGGAGGDVPLRVRRARHGRLPGVQLDGRVAARDQLQREVGVGLRRIEPARQVIAAHRAAIGRHLVAEGAQQLVHRLAQRASGQVPERQVHRFQRPVCQRGTEALAFIERLPDALAVEGVLACQQRPHQSVHDAIVDTEAVAADASVRGDGEQGLPRFMHVRRMTVAIAVAALVAAVSKGLAQYVSDNHGHTVKYALAGAPW